LCFFDILFSDGFNHWRIIENGGHRFAVEPNECGFSDPVSSIGVPGKGKYFQTDTSLLLF